MDRKKLRNILAQIFSLWLLWIIIRLMLTRAIDEFDLFIVRSLYTLLCIGIVISINVIYLVPLFFRSKKYVFYFFSSFLVIFVTMFLVYYDFFPWGKWYFSYSYDKMLEYRPGDTVYIIKWLPKLAPLLIAFLGSSLMEMFKYANKKEAEVIEAEKEKLTTELKFLKSQVNPHFLFNALNNIYSLSVSKSGETPESIMQLSEILRYMVYDSRESKVSLRDEINYIQSYVNLTKLKDSKGMNVSVYIEPSDVLIAPLLFVPFIENAFKHSKIESVNESFISLRLTTKENIINFSIKNSLPKTNFTKDKVGGIGIENTKKRLNLLYYEKHSLSINKTEDTFEVNLTITT